MKKDPKSKANSGAKSPAAKSAQKSAVKSTKITNASKGAGASKPAGTNKATSAKAKTVPVKTKAPSAEVKAVKTIEHLRGLMD